MEIKDLAPEQRISYSEIKKYTTCSRAHDFAYIAGLRPLGERSAALERGTDNHEVMAQYFAARMEAEAAGKSDPHHEGFQAALFFILEQRSQFQATLMQLLDFFYKANPLPPAQYKIRSFEQSFGIKLLDNFYYVFSPDVVVEHLSGKMYVIDIKTIASFYTYDVIDLDMQLPSYVWGLQRFGLNIEDAAFLMMRHSFAKTKQVEPNEVIRLSFLSVRPERISNVVSQIYAAKRSIELADPLRTSNDLACNRCEFKSICITTLNGDDPSSLIGSFYERKPDRIMEGVMVNE